MILLMVLCSELAINVDRKRIERGWAIKVVDVRPNLTKLSEPRI